MTVVELDLRDFTEGKLPRIRNAGVFIKDRLKGVLDVGVAWWKRESYLDS